YVCCCWPGRCCSSRTAPPAPPLLPYTTLFRSTSLLVPYHTIFAFLAVPYTLYVLVRAALRRRPASQYTLVGGLIFLTTVVLSMLDRKSTRLTSSHVKISYAVFCLKKKNTPQTP